MAEKNTVSPFSETALYAEPLLPEPSSVPQSLISLSFGIAQDRRFVLYADERGFDPPAPEYAYW